MQSELTGFEREVLLLLVEMAAEDSDLLMRQIEAAKVVSREYTGSGLYVNLHTSENESKCERVSSPVGNIFGDCSQLENGFGATLFLDEGIISFLEFYTYGESWPNIITGYTLTPVTNHN